MSSEAQFSLSDGASRARWSWSSKGRAVSVELTPLPWVSIALGRRLRLEFGLGLLLTLGLLWLVGSLIWELGSEIAASSYAEAAGLSADSDIAAFSSGSFGFLLATLLILSTAIHELGHGLGYLLTGRSWDRLQLSFKSHAVTSDPPANSYQQFIATVLGGGLQAAAGTAVLIALGGPGWDLLQVAAILSIGQGMLNLLLPMGANSDGSKFWKHLGRILIGRGGAQLQNRAEELSDPGADSSTSQ